MSWRLNGTTFTPPDSKSVDYNTQKALNRTISGANNIDYIGTERLYVACSWNFINATDWAFVKGMYDNQRLYGNPVFLDIDELNVHLYVIIAIQSYSPPIANNYMYGRLKLDFIQT